MTVGDLKIGDRFRFIEPHPAHLGPKCHHLRTLTPNQRDVEDDFATCTKCETCERSVVGRDFIVVSKSRFVELDFVTIIMNRTEE